jgi:hypothetical protein
MSNADVLLKALENDDNNFILNHTTEKIEKSKKELFEELNLNNEEIEDFMKKLEDYIYISEIPEIVLGCYMRWIPLKDPENIFLTRGAMICDINICAKGTSVVCTNRNKKYMQINMDEALVFRKLTPQEKILLSAMNYLKK